MWSAMLLPAYRCRLGAVCISAATFRTLRNSITADGDFLALADIKRNYGALRAKRCPITKYL